MIAIAGAAAVSPLGLDWRGLASGRGAHPATLLRATHPEVAGFEVPPIPPERDAGDAKSRRVMSRGARFAAIAARDALREAGWATRKGVGYWLGVGASGGPLAELVAMLGLSLDAGAVSLARLGSDGLLASNPVHTFQVLNNFSMCHGAILDGTTGPTGAFYSRGAGTVHALAEAMYALESGDCERALAGGSDTALHPVTWAELARDGFAAGGLVPSEGAGVLALARAADGPLAFVEHAGVGDASPARGVELVAIAPWGAEVRPRLTALARETGARELFDATAALGESLAATPALAWLVAVDLLRVGRARRAAVLSQGPDGELGVVVLRGAG